MIKRSFDPSKPHGYYCYGRMSDEQQNPRSPDQQFDMIDTTLSRCGYHHWVHQWDYRDDGRSGRFIHKRPGFNQLLQDVQTGRIKPGSAVLVDSIERWGRAKKLKSIRDELYKKYGIVVLAANNNFADPTNETGEVVACVEDIRAWSDGAKKAHEVLRGKIDTAKQKKWPGGPRPVGYKLEVRQETRSRRSGREIIDHYSVLVPNPATAEIPRRIFALAHEHGWGPDRTTKTLNADENFVARFGKISRDTVAYIMDNPIYGGTLRFNLNATDIEDDCRIVQRNPDDEVLYVEDFCDAIVEKQIVQKVRADVKRRAEARAAIVEANKTAEEEDVACLGCGVSVKYPLAGLVRCGGCRAAMRASVSGAQSETAASYYYWRCPNTSDGRCDNKEYLRGPWLWEAVCDSLKHGLFPGFDAANGPSAAAIEELCEQVRHALKVRHKSSQDQRPLKEAELAQIETQLAGWRTSLANPRLSSVLRQDIEKDYERAADRKVRLEVDLETLGTSDADIEARVNPVVVIEKIRRLADLLARTNVADLNVELSYHIVAIEVFPEGRVTIHLNRLGVLAGNVPELYEEHEPVEEMHAGVYRVRPRALSRRKTTAELGRSPLARPAGMMEQVVVPDEWSEVITLQQPSIVYPYQEHARDIAARRLEDATHEALCLEFDMTPPTIRKALKYAQEELGIDLSRLPKKMARANWAKDHAKEVARLKASGMSTVELAEHFGVSDTTIRTALKNAESNGG